MEDEIVLDVLWLVEGDTDEGILKGLASWKLSFHFLLCVAWMLCLWTAGHRRSAVAQIM